MLGLFLLILSRGITSNLSTLRIFSIINTDLSSGPDTHVTILPEFTVPAGRMADFQVINIMNKDDIQEIHRLGLKNSTQPPRLELEHQGVFTTDSLFLVTVSTAERDTRSVDDHLDDFMMLDVHQNAEAAMLHGADIKAIAAEPMKVSI